MGIGKKRYTAVINTIIIVLVVVVVVMVSFYYIRTIKDNVREETSQYLEEIAIESAKLVQEKFNSGQTTLAGMAAVIGETDVAVDSPAVVRALQEEMKKVNFKEMSVESLDGQAYNIMSGHYRDVSQMEYFKKASKGTPLISLIDTEDGSQNVVSAVPIYRNGSVIGVLEGRYNVEDLIELLSITTFGGEGYSYLSTNKGEIFAVADHPNAQQSLKNINENFKNCSFGSPYALQEMQINMYEGKSGVIEYQRNSTQRMMSYTPLMLNGWYLLSVVPESVIIGKSSYLLSQAALLCSILCVVFTGSTIYVYYLQKRKSEALKRANQQISESQKRYDLIMGQCQETIFEWNIEKDRVYYSRYFKEKFGVEPIREGFPQKVIAQGVIFKADEPVFLKLFEDAAKKEGFFEAEMRIVNSACEPIWCSVRMVSMVDDWGTVCKMVGVISDIDEKKKEQDRISEAADRDFLTKLYNKGAAERLISQWFEQSLGKEKSALFVLDVDDFKSVNDNYGHIYGDQVLREVSDHLTSVMDEEDIVGRIGGDEFVILMKSVQNEAVLRAKAKALVAVFNECLKNESCTISGSIGAALYPEDGKEYETLFMKA
ncbi:MAG: diguanylate cyclase, partial [Eubacterium sp.]